MDYIKDIKNCDLYDYAKKMSKEIVESVAWWDLGDDDTEENMADELYISLKELQRIVKEDDKNSRNSKLSPLYHCIVNRYLE